jgi:hypothetical protein
MAESNCHSHFAGPASQGLSRRNRFRGPNGTHRGAKRIREGDRLDAGNRGSACSYVLSPFAPCAVCALEGRLESQLEDVIAVFMGTAIVLIPVLGLTIRFTVKPVLEALIQAGVIGGQKTQGAQASQADLLRLERRVLELEQRLTKVKERARPELAAVDPVGNEAQLLPDVQRVGR